MKNVKDSRIEYFADWKYNLLYHFSFSWFSAVTALNQETDSRGNPAKKHCLIDKEIVQEMAENAMKMWYTYKVQSSLFAVGKEQRC